MVSFGDLRLDKRYANFESVMVRRCSVILRQLATNRNEEIGYGRFLRHPKVTMSKILGSAYERCKTACQGRHVLMIQDTSAMGFGLNPKAGLMGPISTNLTRGFYLHPVICLDAIQGVCLGLSNAQILQRDDNGGKDTPLPLKERKRIRRLRPFEEKESFRWWSSIRDSIKQVDTACEYTLIADSEADIYDLMARNIEHGVGYVLRSFQNRPLNSSRSGYRIKDHLSQQEVQASYEVNLPTTDKRSAHQAILEVKWTQVNISRPHDIQDKKLPKILKTNLIEVKESIKSVVGKEKPVHWKLLTSHPIENFEQVRQVIRWYTWRWVIEQLFRTIKNKGLDIQNAQVESEHALKNLTAVALVSGVQIMQLVQAREGNNDLLAIHVFTKQENKLLKKLNPTLQGNTEKLKNPHPPNSLAYASWVIARLGGWSGYKSQRPPGPITMANGLKRFREATYFSHLFSKN